MMIGYVPQKSLLFSGTIVENLRHGKKDATAEEIAHACKIAQVNDYINSLSEGLETSVAQGGNNFSGGTKTKTSDCACINQKA